MTLIRIPLILILIFLVTPHVAYSQTGQKQGTVQVARLDSLDKQLITRSQKSDFSLSWEHIIVVPKPKQSFKKRVNKKLKMTFVSKNLLQKYRSRKGALPKGWPVRQGRVSSLFGKRWKRMHKGIDIAAKTGTSVFSVEDGVVIRSKYVGAYGLLVEIRHSKTYTTRYGHNSKLLVKVGQKVKRGQKIARVGSTGRSTGPHVHFEIRQNNVPINPIKYLGTMDKFRLSNNVKLSKYVKLTKK
ncbi:MAG: M23 family metallopeptidase [Thiomargarita sp.]|nr:M23 family metallopeptidase [Thiomargarita sp.]